MTASVLTPARREHQRLLENARQAALFATAEEAVELQALVAAYAAGIVERRDALQALLALRRTQQDRQGPT